MMTQPNLVEAINFGVRELPAEMQAEVYDFVTFLKTRQNPKQSKRIVKKKSLCDLIGIGESSVTDGSVNHDKYLYE
jgi:hypothetical protein